MIAYKIKRTKSKYYTHDSISSLSHKSHLKDQRVSSKGAKDIYNRKKIITRRKGRAAHCTIIIPFCGRIKDNGGKVRQREIIRLTRVLRPLYTILNEKS